MKLGKNDPHTRVKGDALYSLSTYFSDDKDIVPVLTANVSNESYYVAGSALSGLAEADKTEALKYAKQYESETNLDLINAVAEVYEVHGGVEQHEFFKKKYYELDGYGKYSFVHSYGNYLKKQPNEVISEAIPVLKDISLNEKAWWMRMTGINVVVELENQSVQKINDYNKSLKSLKSDSPEAVDLNSKIEATTAVDNKLMELIETIRSSETNPRLKRMLGIK